MPRRKLTDAEKNEIKAKATAKRLEQNLVSDLARLRECYFGEPTIIYKVGDRVSIGNIKESVITEVLDGGRIYEVHQTCTENNYGNPYDYERDAYVAWCHIEPYLSIEDRKKIPILQVEDDVEIRFSCFGIESVAHCFWDFGIETETEYQRGNVWTPEQRVQLIDSVFNKIQIGSFAVLRRKFKEGEKGYEIIDGKQRLLTIIAFMESRLPYKGYLFRDMNPHDRNHFETFTVSWGTVENLSRLQVYRLFLKLNTSGKPQEQAHIDKVKQMYDEELKKEVQHAD